MPLDDAVFEDLQSAAIDIWEEYDNTYGYVDEKVEMVENVMNRNSDFIRIINMFDHSNKLKLLARVGLPETRALVEKVVREEYSAMEELKKKRRSRYVKIDS